ncbi:hypothetical protein GWK47_014800 [Chionoecetes opilio]|uniref:Uncharacterized protein n=1 Tax=Chionoecetes opilio TaxID=41210 RepID=A0A8J5CKD6_CHIOP|nr:hypothetical protein GWK47_014800 [Chionoecetes opilio]
MAASSKVVPSPSPSSWSSPFIDTSWSCTSMDTGVVVGGTAVSWTRLSCPCTLGKPFIGVTKLRELKLTTITTKVMRKMVRRYEGKVSARTARKGFITTTISIEAATMEPMTATGMPSCSATTARKGMMGDMPAGPRRSYICAKSMTSQRQTLPLGASLRQPSLAGSSKRTYSISVTSQDQYHGVDLHHLDEEV